jgi:hypothetical protein
VEVIDGARSGNLHVTEGLSVGKHLVEVVGYDAAEVGLRQVC